MPQLWRRLRVLVACERSNVVRDAFLARGHDAWSCDLQIAEHPNANYKRHLRCDARPLLRERWDLVIAHPPCTYLSVMSQCRFVKGVPIEKQPRYQRMLSGLRFFVDCLCANAERVAVENPLPNSLTRELIGDPTQIIEPYEYGEPYLKATALWLKMLPLLKPTNIVQPIDKWVSTGKGGLMRDVNMRSKTFQGIADAMADQWGEYVATQ